KPQHGSDEWHRQRRENHKEVERRRRESINHGIKDLAALIPTNDTNKAQILQRAVEYIKRLKENENNNIEKWTLEKLLTEQAVSELSASNEKLKQELERAYREIEQWKEMARGGEKK
ncbi:centromere-binding kinetochore protein, partial [Scheffersomyces stipitis CBS 6054]